MKLNFENSENKLSEKKEPEHIEKNLIDENVKEDENINFLKKKDSTFNDENVEKKKAKGN